MTEPGPALLHCTGVPPLRVVFFGTPALALPTLQALADHPREFALVGVVSQPDRPAGRGQALTAPPVAAWARSHGVPLLQPKGVRGAAFLDALRSLRADVAVVIAYGRILPAAVLGLPPLGCINVHASLLPAYRGAGPIQRAVLDGVSVTGVTTMWMDEGLDTGPMLLRSEVPVQPGDTAASLGARLAASGAELLLATLRAACGPEGLRPIPQDAAMATMAPLITKEEGRIDWARPAAALERQVRGLWPWPGAFTTLAGAGLKVHRARVEDVHDGLSPPGTVARAGPGGVAVATGEGLLWLEEVQREGRKSMTGAAFAIGHPFLLGTRLGADSPPGDEPP